MSASWRRSFRSARTAAWLGEVSRPRSWAASAAEVASGSGAAVERDLAAGVARLGPEVLAVQVHAAAGR